MVNEKMSPRAQRRQQRGLERREAEYGARMVQRFERTGQLASTRSQSIVANRIAQGGGPMTAAQLKAELDRQALAPGKQRYSYACSECGAEALWPRQAGEGPKPRCPSCRRKARLATKRATWHRYKEQYRSGARRTTPTPAPLDPLPAPDPTPAVAAPAPISKQGRVIWSPEA